MKTKRRVCKEPVVARCCGEDGSGRVTYLRRTRTYTVRVPYADKMQKLKFKSRDEALRVLKVLCGYTL